MSCVARPYAEKFEQPADYWMDTMFQQQQQRGSFFLPPFMHADQSHIDQLFNNEMSGFYHNADNSGTSSPVSDFSPESSPLSECYSPVEDDYQAVWSFNQPIFSSYPSQEVHFYHPEPIYRDASAYGMVAPAPSASFVQPKETSAFAPVERVYNPQPAAPVIAAAKDLAAREAVDDADAAKQRISWTHELHTAFLRAYDTLGDEATPKKIMFIMRAQGVCMKSITRLKVASHLQRHEKKLGLARRPSVTKKLMSGAPSKDKSQSQAE